MKKLFISACMLLALATGIRAQQDPAYSMYMFNGLFLNPAYAGSQEVLDVMGILREQWVGIEGAPQTANISMNTPFRREQYAAGLVISNDNLGLSNTFTVTPSFCYRLRFSNHTKLCFGIQGSFSYYYENNAKAQTAIGSDPAYSYNSSLFVPNVGFGIYYYGDRFFAGISAPHLLPSELGAKVGVSSYTDTSVSHQYNQYVFTAGYVFGKDPAIVKFRPTILLKWQQGLPHNVPQIDISPAFLLVDRLWLGVTYRSGGDVGYYGQAIIAFMQVRVTPQLQIGFAYDAEMTQLRHYTSGTYEVMVGYSFWYNKKRFVTPRYVKYF